jgi:endoglucanase
VERLRTIGHQLFAGDRPVLLRGVNRSGLEYSRGAIEARELDEIAGWGANFLRVPFNQAWLLEDASYLDELTQVAELAAARGMYVLLDLQWLAYGQRRGTNPDGSNIATPPLPDLESPRAWAMLAARFGGNPAVMFDLLNEPHARLPDDPFPLVAPDGTPLAADEVGPAEWHPWVHALVAAIRPLAPETLLFVSGTDWGFQLAPLALDGIVHAAHVYPHPGKRTRADWQRGFAQLARTQPVVITELGPVGELADVVELLDFLDEQQLGWAAWSWSDWPRLVVHAQAGDYTPTPFGREVLHRLSRRGS